MIKKEEIQRKLDDTIDAKQDSELLEDFYQDIIGKTLNIEGNSIQITEHLGQGSMGSVYKAKMNNEDIAVKILAPHLAGIKEFRNRFSNEANTMIKLPKHPHLVHGLCYGIDEANMFEFTSSGMSKKIKLHALGMEYVEGRSLEKILEERTEPLPEIHTNMPPDEKKVLTTSKPLPISQACNIITQIGRALVMAHDLKKLHRDIKPGNILLDYEGCAKLTDLGLVKEFGAADQTAIGLTVGTPLYMPPEQLLHEFSFSSDLYSLAATLYHLVTGHYPFKGIKEGKFSMDNLYQQILHDPPIPPRELNPYISEDLQDEIMRAMEKQVKYRHLKLKEFVEEIESLEKQTFDEKVKKKWLEMHGSNEMKKKVFDMIFSKEYIDIRQNITGTPKDIIKECRKIERALLLDELQYFNPQESGLETQMRSIENIERLMRITPRKKENVLEREDWLNMMLGVWDNLLTSNPDLVLDKGSTQNKLNWEERMRERLGVIKPEPPKTFWERNGKKILAFAFAGMMAITTGALGHIWGVSNKRAREQEQKNIEIRLTREDFNTTYITAKDKIQRFDFENAEDDIKKLTALQGKIGDSSLEDEIEDIEELLQEKKEAHAALVRDQAIESDIKKAYEALKASGEEELSKEERDAELQSAADLSKKIEEAVKDMEGSKADYFRRELDIIVGKLGPQLYAFETLHDAEMQYEEAKKKYDALLLDWQGDKPLPQGIIAALRREVSGAKEALLRVEGDFTDEKKKKTPAYTSIQQDIEGIITLLEQFHKDISFGQLSRARTSLQEIQTIIAELKKDKKYLTDEDSEGKVQALEEQIQTYLSNIEGSPFIWKGSMQGFRKDLERTIEIYTPIKEKMTRARELREKGGIELGEFYFDEQAYALAKKCFSGIDSDTARLYLSVIRLERRMAEERIIVRERLSQKQIDDYCELVGLLKKKHTGQTPSYIMQGIMPMLDQFSKIPDLYFLMQSAKRKISELNKLAWKVDTSEVEQEYSAKIDSFIDQVKKERAFAEVEKALRAYIRWGEEEPNPEIALLLADTYTALGRKKQALQKYQIYLTSSLITEEDKEEARKAIQKIENN